MLSGSVTAALLAVAVLASRVTLCRCVERRFGLPRQRLLAHSAAGCLGFRHLCGELLRGDGSLAGFRLSRGGGRHPDRGQDLRRPMMRTLCLQAPSFDGFDGGAGSRYQARREIRSYWYPTWLAQVAAVVPAASSSTPCRIGSRWPTSCATRATTISRCCIPRRLRSAPMSRVIEALKAANPRLKAGFVGAKVAVEPQASLERSPADRLRRRQRVRLHHQGNRRGARLEQHHRPVLSRRRRRDPAQPAARRCWKTWTNCRSSRRSTNAT